MKHIKETRIEYMTYDGYHAGGLTVRLNKEGEIKRCETNTTK